MTAPPFVTPTLPQTTEPGWGTHRASSPQDHLRKSTVAATPPLPLPRLVRLNPAPSSVPRLFFFHGGLLDIRDPDCFLSTLLHLGSRTWEAHPDLEHNDPRSSLPGGALSAAQPIPRGVAAGNLCAAPGA